MANILIIDDEEMLCRGLGAAIIRMGHNVDCSHTIVEGLKKADSGFYDVILLDVCLPDGNGLEVLMGIKASPSSPEIIILTGKGDPDGAEMAIINGAWSYLEKPVLKDVLALQLENALKYRDEKKARKKMTVLKRDGIVGDSPQINKCLGFVAQAAESNINVLITGETGTGKECFAYAIHENSKRAKGNFVIVDCAALPETLVESTLFGNVRGAFTGADRDREGLIKQADKGTLFLDEIGELPLSVQKAFLRVLQEHRFRAVGGKVELSSEFRLIAATNRDLNQMVADGLFREDLFFRIKSLTIPLPSLRERRQDIQKLAMYYILQICEREGISSKGFSSEFMETIDGYNWPGNVRELFNAIEWAVSKARYEQTLFAKHLPDHVRISVARYSVRRINTDDETACKSDQNITWGYLPKLKEFRDAIISENEKKYLHRLISMTKGNIDMACSISGLGRSRLYGLMKNYGIFKTY